MSSVRQPTWPSRGTKTLADWRATPDDGNRYELLEGEIVMSPPPAPLHQWALMNLAGVLYPHVRLLGMMFVAPIGVELSDLNAPEPDLIFIARERLSIVTRKRIDGAPDLVVEVLSPSTEKYDRTIKKDLYARFGVRHYWLVQPEARTLEALELGDDGRYRDIASLMGEATFEPALFPGLRIALADLWWPAADGSVGS